MYVTNAFRSAEADSEGILELRRQANSDMRSSEISYSLEKKALVSRVKQEAGMDVQTEREKGYAGCPKLTGRHHLVSSGREVREREPYILLWIIN